MLSSELQVVLLAPISSVKITEMCSPCLVNHTDFLQQTTSWSQGEMWCSVLFKCSLSIKA